MKVTVDGIVYEGTEDEIRRIVENPPRTPSVRINWVRINWPEGDFPRNWDGSPKVTCGSEGGAR